MLDSQTSAVDTRRQSLRLPVCPTRVIIDPCDLKIHTDRSYVGFLRRNGIKIDAITAGSLRLSEIIGTRWIGVGIVLVLLASTVVGFAFGCRGAFNAGCRAESFFETKTIFNEATKRESPRGPWVAAPVTPARPATDAAPQPAAGPSETPTLAGGTVTVGSAENSLIDRRQRRGAPFHLAAFQASIIVCGFVLAFSRWMIENRQSSMSELFERKKEVNLLLLKDEKGVFEPLISDAVRTEPPPPELPLIDLGASRCLELRDAAMKEPPIDSSPTPSKLEALRSATLRRIGFAAVAEPPDNAQFLRQMFVYIELDNFELALNRYTAGLLDPEQMFRAWEIIQSRCLNPTFRRMAALQGLRYYTDEFHAALQPVLIRTQYLYELKARDVS